MTTVGDDGGWAMEVGRAHPEGCDGVCSRAASVLVGGGERSGLISPYSTLLRQAIHNLSTGLQV